MRACRFGCVGRLGRLQTAMKFRRTWHGFGVSCERFDASWSAWGWDGWRLKYERWPTNARLSVGPARFWAM